MAEVAAQTEGQLAHGPSTFRPEEATGGERRTTLPTIVIEQAIALVFHARPFADVLLRARPSLYTGVTATPIIPSGSTPASTSGRPLLLTVEQTAELLALSRSSIYQLIWSEQLVPIRIGRSVRFSVQQIEDFISDRQVMQSR